MRDRDYLPELAALYIVDLTGNLYGVGDELGAAQSLHIVAHALFEVREREEVAAGGIHSEVLFYLRRQVLVPEREHPAVGVVDDHDFAGPQQPLGDDERTYGVLRDAASGVAYNVRVPNVEPEELLRVQPRVHASHHRDLPGRGRR